MAHVCAQLKRNILGLSVSNIQLQNDKLLFPALKTCANDTAAKKELEKIGQSLNLSTIDSVGRHGKYFWIRYLKDSGIHVKNNRTKRMKTPPEGGVLLMHFGMTGMVKLKGIKSHLIFMENGGDKVVLEKKIKSDSSVIKLEDEELEEGSNLPEQSEDVWPPKYTKFEMTLSGEGSEISFAFDDPRRLGRIRVFYEPLTDFQLLESEPLSAQGPDYSKPLKFPVLNDQDFIQGDPDPNNHGRPILSFEQFKELILKKKKPIKALLLDQGLFAGVGNWVGDEICYQARIHPNDVLSTALTKIDDTNISDAILKRLYDALIYVCSESVRVEGEVVQFPEDWLMLYRWGKRRKNVVQKTPQGHRVDYITIGGRTSCYVPELQKPITKNTGKINPDSTVQK